MNKNQMSNLLDRLFEVQFQSDSFARDSPNRAQPQAPASKTEIARLESHLGAKSITIPPSYRQFLQIANGVKWYRSLQTFHLRSVQEIIDGAKEDSFWDWLGPCDFVIGRGDATSMCSFDPSTVDSSGEMAVVEFTVEADQTVHANFVELLQYDLRYQEKNLAIEQAARANLADD